MKGIFKSILILSFFAIFGMAKADDLVVGPFSGLNNTDNPLVIPAQNAQDLLNVDITAGGKSVKKRKGYGTAFTMAITTSPVHGIFNFYDSSGNDISLFFNDTRISASVSGGGITVLSSTGTNGATYQCVDSQGQAYCTNSARTNVLKTNGVTFSPLPVNSTGTLVAVTPDRLVISGISEAPNRIDFSKAGDFTTWTIGINNSDPVQITLSAPGSKVTHITYAFGRLIWFKDSSFGNILFGPTQADWKNTTISPNVGTLDNTSFFWNGVLYFRGQDGHLYGYDGSNLNKITREITATINLSQTRRTNSWTQTTQADWQLGNVTPQTYLSTASVNGSVVLDTAAAVSSFVDTASTDFGAGTLTNIDTTSISGSAQLSLLPEYTDVSRYPAGTSLCTDACSSPNYQALKVTAASNFILTSVLMRLKKIGSPGSVLVEFMSDSGGSPGSVLDSVTVGGGSVSTSIGDVTATFSGRIPVVNGTSYWVMLIPQGTCDGSNQIEWAATSGGAIGYCGTSTTSPLLYGYKVNGSTYASSGNIVSRTFDVGFTTNTWLWAWNTFTANSTSGNQTLTFQTQTSSSSTGVWDTVTSVVSGSTPTSTVREFIRYKANFSTSNSTSTPSLQDVTLSMTPRIRPTGTFDSQVKNAPSLTSWDYFNATKQDNGGSHTFYIRSSTNAITLASSTPTWTLLSNGAIPTISTGSFFQIRDVFLALTYADNPKLDDFTQNWVEGNASDKAYATYFDNSIWWAITSGSGATANNRIIRYDLLNQTNTLYDIAANGFLVRNQSLYFGSASAGYIYKFGVSDNDGGSAINAYWKSKDFFGASPFNNKDFTSLSVSASSIQNSSMTVTYTTNGSSATAYTMNLYNPSSSFQRKNVLLPLGTTGSTLNVQFGNNAADQPFELFAADALYVNRPWVQSQ